VRLEANTKPHVHQEFEIFWTNIASTMTCPNFQNGPKNGLRPLDINLGGDHRNVPLVGYSSCRGTTQKTGFSVIWYLVLCR
jgi:hypothetical protein